MENRYAVTVEDLVSTARVDRAEQVEAQETGVRPEPLWRGPVPPWLGGGGGALDADGDGD